MRGHVTGKTIRFSVPNAVHRTLLSRAAREGLTLSALVLRELEKIAKRPTEAEMRRRLAALSLLDRKGTKKTR